MTQITMKGMKDIQMNHLNTKMKSYVLTYCNEWYNNEKAIIIQSIESKKIREDLLYVVKNKI